MTQDRSISATFSINSYNLQVSSTTGGSVSGSGSYDYGSSASILATPQTGYQFVGWTGDGINDQNSTSTSVLITQDTNISAVFSIKLYSLSVVAGNGGSISGGGDFEHGTDANISAISEQGYSFSAWSGDGISDPISTNTTVAMTQDRSISATFSINSYNLQVSSTTGGSVSGSGSYHYGSSASILATPQTGYQFVGWTGDGINDQNSTSTSVLITQDTNISAVFSIKSYSLSIVAGNGGSISGGGDFEHGTDANISAIPEQGYSFSGWSGDGIANSSDANTTVAMTQDRSISATFSINSYNLQVSSTTGGSVSGSGSYDYGSSASILATPQTGYQFVGWTGDGINDQNSTGTSVLITQDTNISAVFSIKSYSLSIFDGNGGFISGGGDFEHGTDANISAISEQGYSFSGWSGDGISDPISTNTTVAMTQDRSISATFSINSYNLQVSSTTGDLSLGVVPMITDHPRAYWQLLKLGINSFVGPAMGSMIKTPRALLF